MTVLNDHTSVNAIFMGTDGRVIEKTHIIWYKDRDPDNPRLPSAADTLEIREEIKHYHQAMEVQPC